MEKVRLSPWTIQPVFWHNGKQAIQEIHQELGEKSISTDDEDLKMHGYSEWSSVNIDRLPVAVAYPESTEQVATIARICHKHKVPMSKYQYLSAETQTFWLSYLVPYSGGSSVEGHFSAPFGGISVDFLNMSKVVAFHPEEFVYPVQSHWVRRITDWGSMDIIVQPSVSWMELNEDIKESGLFFPVDPGPPVWYNPWRTSCL